MLDFFDMYLPEKWEIYIQPHLNGLRPDFVLLNPAVGIGVFEVKDWDLRAMQYYLGRGVRPVLLARNREGVEFVVKDNPVEKVFAYKHKLYQLHMPRLGLDKITDKQKFALITAGVIFTVAPTQDVQHLLNPFKDHLGMTPKMYYPIVGADALAGGRNGLFRVFPGARFPQSKIMAEKYAEELRYWLVEPDHAEAQRRPLELDPRQRQLATSRTESGFRRIKGPAGSGKSQVLAARAAQLSSEGKEVLVVTFNITLWHYLQDLAVRYPVQGRRVKQNVTWTHFHGWCGDICRLAGLWEEYRSLVGNNEPLGHDQDGDMLALLMPREGQGREDVFENQVPALVDRALGAHENTGGLLPTYDAILVDEGQDFTLKWWNLLKRVKKRGGEMLLVADHAQDLYSRAQTWTEESMRGAGFFGDWIQLNDCYRVPPALIPHLREFASRFMPQHLEDVPSAAPALLALGFPVHLKWVQISPAVPAEPRAVDELLGLLGGERRLAGADLTLLLPTHTIGLRCMEILKSKGLEAAHVFGENDEESRLLKIAFYMGDARLKSATVHSFKGWESRAMVVLVDSASGEPSRIAIHVALTRLKCHADGSYLTVICRDAALRDYGRTWPEFVAV